MFDHRETVLVETSLVHVRNGGIEAKINMRHRGFKSKFQCRMRGEIEFYP